MATPPSSPPPPPPPDSTSHSPSTMKRTRKVTRLRSLATRPVGAEKPLVQVDPATGKANGPHRKKLRTYLGIVTCDKAGFDIPEASDLRMKNKILQTMGKQWRQFKTDSTLKWDVRKKAQTIQKQNIASHVLSCEGCEFLENKLMEEKKTKQLEEAAKFGSTNIVIDPPSPIRRHMKWKMACTKKTDQMTSEATKEIDDKIDSLVEQASQGSFVAHRRQDVLTAAIERLEHPGCVRAVGASGSQGLALPPESEVSPSAARVSTKESSVDPLGNDPDTGDLEKCGLYVEENPPRLVALGRLCEGLKTVHNIPFCNDQIKVGVEEVRDADAPIPVPTQEVQLVGQTLNTFVA
ncbi:hypothetical protein HKD37_07G019447 [Glycine soja]